LSLLRYRDVGIINWLLLRRDFLDYAWATWVLGYDRRQAEALQRLLGKVTMPRLVLLFAAAVAVSLLPYLVMRIIRRRWIRPDPRDALIRKFCEKMARAGMPRKTGEGILDYARRIATENPQAGADAMAIADAYIGLRYGDQPSMGIEELRARIRQFSATG
jgi:hypothetical protein